MKIADSQIISLSQVEFFRFPRTYRIVIGGIEPIL